MRGHILVVEDEADLAELVSFNLKQAGYTTSIAGDGAAALAAVASRKPDLVVLDLMLPDISGTEVCRRIRASDEWRDIPVVMLTARGEEVDRVMGFEVGADDYIVKPFSPREFVLRVSAVLRRASPPPSSPPPPIASAADDDASITIGAMTIDVPRHEVRIDGATIPLTALEFKLLLDLASRKGRVQSRDSLLDRVWGYTPGIETRTVDTHVKRLREKLRGASHYIETVRGVGYRMRDDVAALSPTK
ncbi:MAG: DNA-binding response regulator [Deltaproteobacteria bacterium]|nr:MAG: DNA-binding response regulator [Deltaproteobacteria bacterium]